MADIIDEANKVADLFLSTALSNRRHNAKVTTPGVGFCLSCGEEVDGDRRWCDAACRNDYEAQQKRRERNGN